MGANLGKKKSVSISEVIKTHENETATSPTINANGTATSEDLKQFGKKMKKKKEKNVNKKSSKTKVDKSTGTDGCVMSSATIKHLVSASGCTMNNNLLYDVLSAQVNLAYRPETPGRDVLEFRDACIRRGIISADVTIDTLPTPNEQEYQENTTMDTVEESIDEPSTTVVMNDDQIQNEQQQQQQQQVEA